MLWPNTNYFKTRRHEWKCVNKNCETSLNRMNCTFNEHSGIRVHWRWLNKAAMDTVVNAFTDGDWRKLQWTEWSTHSLKVTKQSCNGHSGQRFRWRWLNIVAMDTVVNVFTEGDWSKLHWKSTYVSTVSTPLELRWCRRWPGRIRKAEPTDARHFFIDPRSWNTFL